ncbi:hypothetical protein IE4803_PB00004 (plasmid) [Rhizobium etli bv. phaseoli str. IE4803]|nr:hypothetical protein IE4803_PB00004 [Rhizobium etli bv. phaseoli str. IE4803]
MITEKSALARELGWPCATLITAHVPPILAEIFLKGRKTRRFRSSKATDIADVDSIQSLPISITYRK